MLCFELAFQGCLHGVAPPAKPSGGGEADTVGKIREVCNVVPQACIVRQVLLTACSDELWYRLVSPMQEAHMPQLSQCDLYHCAKSLYTECPVVTAGCAH